MEALFHSLLMLMLVVWGVAVVMRELGLPTIMGELIMGMTLAFGYDMVAASFVGLTMTATAVVTLKACVSLLKKHPTHWSY